MPPITGRLLLALAFLPGAHAADQLQLNLVPREIVQKRLEQGAVKDHQRENVMQELFAQAGCTVTLQKVRGKWNNVICTLPGQTDSVIAIGAHSDFADLGQGIIDDWSGSSLLPSIFQALKSRTRRHTFVFLSFAQEETGLHGSRHYVKLLAKEDRARYRAFINLECLGLGPVKVWQRRSDPALTQRLADLSAALKLPLAAMNVDDVGDDDTHPFLDAKIPVLSMHSITPESFPLLHSKKDQVEAIRPEDYYNAYRLASFYLAYLDNKLD